METQCCSLRFSMFCPAITVQVSQGLVAGPLLRCCVLLSKYRLSVTCNSLLAVSRCASASFNSRNALSSCTRNAAAWDSACLARVSACNRSCLICRMLTVRVSSESILVLSFFFWRFTWRSFCEVNSLERVSLSTLHCHK